jgi:hypothetical protein
MSKVCKHGETEKSCASREYPRCGNNPCTLQNLPILEKYLKNLHK